MKYLDIIDGQIWTLILMTIFLLWMVFSGGLQTMYGLFGYEPSEYISPSDFCSSFGMEYNFISTDVGFLSRTGYGVCVKIENNTAVETRCFDWGSGIDYYFFDCEERRPK